MITKPEIVFPTQIVEPIGLYHEPLTIDVTFVGELGTTSQSDFYRTDIAIIDEDTIAAGYWGQTTVEIYKRQWDESWAVDQTISKSSTVGRFGSDIAVDGTVMAIGAETDSTLAGQAGGVYMYSYNGTSWDQTQFVFPNDLGNNDRFGLGLALQGNNMFVGAFGWDVTGNQMQGAAYFWKYNGTTWVQTQTLTASDLAQGDNFGRQLALDGNWVAICAPGEDGPGSLTPDCGAVYMFSYNGTTWTQTQKINAPTPQTDGSLGRGLAIKGDWMAIGEPVRTNPTVGSTGKVYLYKNIAGTWTYQQDFISEVDQEIAGGFGFSIAMTDEMLMVGKGQGNEVYLYKLYNGVWIFYRRLYETENFGQSVALIDYFGASMGRRFNEPGRTYAIDFERPDALPNQLFPYQVTKPTQTF